MTDHHQTTTAADHEPPTAEVHAPETAVVGETITVEATHVSADAVHVCWLFDGERGPDGTTAAVSFDEPGTHEVTLVLRDEADNENRITVTVAVSARESGGPTTGTAATTTHGTTGTPTRTTDGTERRGDHDETEFESDDDFGDWSDGDESGGRRAATTASAAGPTATTTPRQSSATGTTSGADATADGTAGERRTATDRGATIGGSGTESARDENGGRATTTDEGGTGGTPGLGVGSGLVALLAAALLVVRRASRD
jgi:PGF-CTERM protein